MIAPTRMALRGMRDAVLLSMTASFDISQRADRRVPAAQWPSHQAGGSLAFIKRSFSPGMKKPAEAGFSTTRVLNP